MCVWEARSLEPIGSTAFSGKTNQSESSTCIELEHGFAALRNSLTDTRFNPSLRVIDPAQPSERATACIVSVQDGSQRTQLFLTVKCGIHMLRGNRTKCGIRKFRAEIQNLEDRARASSEV